MTFLSDYFDIQLQSEEKYHNVVVLIEKGGFTRRTARTPSEGCSTPVRFST